MTLNLPKSVEWLAKALSLGRVDVHHLDAAPRYRLMAARVNRSISRFCIMHATAPLRGRPDDSRTRASSNTFRVVEAHIPSLSTIFTKGNPCMPFTRNMETSRARSPVLA